MDFGPMEQAEKLTAVSLDRIADIVHAANERWWVDLETGEPIERNVGELLMLVTSELAEAMEAHRKGLADDKLPYRDGFSVEIVDAFIRLFDLCGGMKINLGEIFCEKMAYNAKRVDHTREHRLAEGGKKY